MPVYDPFEPVFTELGKLRGKVNTDILRTVPGGPGSPRDLLVQADQTLSKIENDLNQARKKFLYSLPMPEFKKFFPNAPAMAQTLEKMRSREQ